MSDSEIISVRCPVGPKQLLMKIRKQGERPTTSPDNLLELACRDCARAGRQFDPSVKRVLHRYNLAGELIESVVERQK